MFEGLKKIWKKIDQMHQNLLDDTQRHFRSQHREDRASSSLLSHSALVTVNVKMQQSWPISESEISLDHSTSPHTLSDCEFCFQPSSSPLMINSLPSQRFGTISEPVDVPSSPLTSLLMGTPIQIREQSHSSGYESTDGNGLSPTTASRTSGINDFSSCLSLTTEEMMLGTESPIYDIPDDEEFLQENDDEDSFEVLSFDAPPESSVFFKEFPHTTLQSQNNLCDCCHESFSNISSSPARRCYYYGKLYCTRCHTMDLAYIPAKIIKTLDMRLYPVCRRAKTILQMNYYPCIFDLQQDNENLYKSFPILSDIRHLRVQFQKCQVYLSTCTRLGKDSYAKILEEFQTQEHLYQSVHLYSISDLLSLKKIFSMLEKAFHIGRKHVRHCFICQGKGFICEICKNRTDILFSFDESRKIGQCSSCSNIYHRHCWNSIEQDCPRCYRIIQRRHQ